MSRDCAGRTVVTAGSVSPPAVEELRHPRLHVRVGVPRQQRHSGALACGIGHDVVSLEEQTEVDDAEQDEQHQRQDEGKLDELRTALRLPSSWVATSMQPQCRHGAGQYRRGIGESRTATCVERQLRHWSDARQSPIREKRP